MIVKWTRKLLSRGSCWKRPTKIRRNRMRKMTKKDFSQRKINHKNERSSSWRPPSPVNYFLSKLSINSFHGFRIKNNLFCFNTLVLHYVGVHGIIRMHFIFFQSKWLVIDLYLSFIEYDSCRMTHTVWVIPPMSAVTLPLSWTYLL